MEFGQIFFYAVKLNVKACVYTITHHVVTHASACWHLLSFPWSAYLTDIFLSWVSSSETVTLYLCLKQLLHASSHFPIGIGYLGMVADYIDSMQAK